MEPKALIRFLPKTVTQFTSDARSGDTDQQFK